MSEIRAATYGGFSLGSIVLLNYYRNWSRIMAAASPLRMYPYSFMAWAASALITVAAFIALFVLFIVERAVCDDVVFLVGIYIFRVGAILWGSNVDPRGLSVEELVSLWFTASGTIVLLISTGDTYAVYPCAVLVFHHVLVDGMWWPAFRSQTRALGEPLLTFRQPTGYQDPS